MSAGQGHTVTAVQLVTSDADTARLSTPPTDSSGIAAWAAVVAVVMGLVAAGTLAYGWWRVRRAPLDRALLALSVRWRVWRRADRHALRTLAALAGLPHACTLLLAPSSLERALAAHGGQVDAACRARLMRRVVEAS